MAEPFTIDGTEHERGIIDCASCPDGARRHAGCEGGGLIHVQFIDEIAHGDGDESLLYAYRCDGCATDVALDDAMTD